MKKLHFSIGQMALICGVSTQTLRYYDRIGLVKPSVIDPNNSYRFYTSNQVKVLNIIWLLKTLGLSIPGIQSVLSSNNLQQVSNLLHHQLHEVRRKIAELHSSEELLLNHLACLEQALTAGTDSLVEIKQNPPRPVVFLFCKLERVEEEIELKVNQLLEIIRTHELIAVGKLMIIEYTSGTIPVELDLCYEIKPTPKQLAQIKIIPGGNAASTYYQGPYEGFELAVTELTGWIEDNQWSITGPVMKRLVVDISLSSDPRNFLTEIQIPIAKRT